MARHEPAEVRRSQILHAAIEVCSEKGYHASRIDDIAERAGLSKGAVYHHFDSKQSIYVAVLEQMLDEATRTMSRLDAEGLSVAEVLRKIVEEQLTQTEGQAELLHGLIHLFLIAIHEPDFQRRFNEHYDRFLSTGTMLIRHGIERGELRSDIDPEAAARTLLMGIDGIIFLHAVLGQQDTGTETGLLLMRLVLDGLARKDATS